VCASPKLLVLMLDYFEKCITTSDLKVQILYYVLLHVTITNH